MRLKMIYKCEKCPVEYMGEFKINHDKNCPKCGSFLKVRFWQPDKRIQDLLTGKEQA